MNTFTYVLVASVLLTGCFNKDKNDTVDSINTADNKIVQNDINKANTKDIKPLEIGVSECDNYFKNMKLCIEKISPNTAEHLNLLKNSGKLYLKSLLKNSVSRLQRQLKHH